VYLVECPCRQYNEYREKYQGNSEKNHIKTPAVVVYGFLCISYANMYSICI